MTVCAPVWGAVVEGDVLKLAVKAPPSVNRRWRAVNGRVILSEAGREWRREAKAMLESIMPGVDLPLVAPYGISISWWPADSRAQDLDNRVKPILDLLQHLRVITNDSEVLDLKVQKKESQGRDRARMVVRVWTIPPWPTQREEGDQW